MTGAEPRWRSALTGAVLVALTLAGTLDEWGAGPLAGGLATALALAAIALMTPGVRATGKIFVAVGLALAILSLADGHGTEPILLALRKSAFIAAFFVALATLRHAAEASPAIIDCGRFLAAQPPGRRYLALTTGGLLFALPLSYGAIALLGSLAVASANEEPDPDRRRHRKRRMLLAIQRGFVTSLPWSPLAFSMAISTALIPGASWAGAVGPALVTAAILMATGWALDTIFKPRLPGPKAVFASAGSWARLTPLLLLLAIVVAGVGGLHLATGRRAVAAVLVVVPALTLIWVVIQERGRGHAIARRGGRFVARELTGYRTELVFLMLAGVIGTLGGMLLAPYLSALGLDLAAVPTWALLVGIVWGIPLLGQIGANPILAVTLLAPVLPNPGALGLAPNDLIVAITAGWALSGVSSPFTATTLLTGQFAGVPARHVGLVWNSSFLVVAGALVTGWVLLSASL